MMRAQLNVITFFQLFSFSFVMFLQRGARVSAPPNRAHFVYSVLFFFGSYNWNKYPFCFCEKSEYFWNGRQPHNNATFW